MSQTFLSSGGVVFARPDFLCNAIGPVTIPMTNDYMFHALLQNDNEALKGLICFLMHLNHGQVQSVVITNPIELGASISVKDFVLDIKILLNNCTIINLELQVINRHNWPERSLSYLCRAFDSLNPAEDYQKNDFTAKQSAGAAEFHNLPAERSHFGKGCHYCRAETGTVGERRNSPVNEIPCSFQQYRKKPRNYIRGFFCYIINIYFFWLIFMVRLMRFLTSSTPNT